ncbi:hypothetical protein [Rhodococcus sp. B10]|uniref:hypothetical protein n=1 Tax=Rhodococcus sp. B10 TaxID=2695876 RepID=UPI001430A55D|nr:hypothetical protein [Rhodococcus sp. B10]NIL78385.1 hypothetical protein [Rhodococcus sp. B10]
MTLVNPSDDADPEEQSAVDEGEVEDLKPIDQATLDKLMELYAGASEVERSSELDGASPDGPTSDVDLPGFKFLTSLLKATPFTDFVHYQSVSCYTHPEKQDRVSQYCSEHKWVSGFCTFADILLRVVVVLMVLGTIGAILVGAIYKTFYA